MPTVWLLITTVPLALIVTNTSTGLETAVPSVILTLRVVVEPSARPPAVATFNVQGLIMMVRPTARGEPAGKFDVTIVKMHDPKVVVPVAVLTPEAMLNDGVALVLVKAKVVGAVVPKPSTPVGNAKGVLTTAFASLAVTDWAKLDEVVRVGVGPESEPPPPQATRVAVRTVASKNFEVFNMITLVVGGWKKLR